jgi:hypothetical protein
MARGAGEEETVQRKKAIEMRVLKGNCQEMHKQ